MYPAARSTFPKECCNFISMIPALSARGPARRGLTTLRARQPRARGNSHAAVWRLERVDFSDGHGGVLGQCEKVAGAINKVYWCRLFARAHGRQ
jgi:hypothetical protein